MEGKRTVEEQLGRQEGCRRTVWKVRGLQKNSVKGKRAVEEQYGRQEGYGKIVWMVSRL